jgi:iron(III) transport system ATP-binding protein
MTSSPPSLALRIAELSVTHPQAQRPVVFGLNLALNHGDIACLLGTSGCGKTTLLRAIAGFIPASHGFIEINQVVCSTPHHTLNPEQRQVGMVFQDYALFPHLNVQNNIEFGLHKQPQAQKQRRSTELLELVGLGALAQRFPHELSGGQQQRVALARALAPKPNLVLLDEPFSNLDIELRERLATEVRDILKAEGASALMVTHDQSEAFGMADMLGVMQEGRLQQWCAPYN